MSLNQTRVQSRYQQIQETAFQTVISGARQFAGSFGLEPFKIIEIKEEQDRNILLRLKDFRQFAAGPSSFVIYTVRPAIGKQVVEAFIRDLSAQKNISRETLSAERRLLQGSINQKNSEGKDWASRQAAHSLQTLQFRSSSLGLYTQVVDKIQDSSLDNLLQGEITGWRILYIVGLREKSRQSAIIN